jgi:hypothetical protein
METNPIPKVTPMVRPICPPNEAAEEAVFSPTVLRISDRMKATTSSITAAPSRAVPSFVRLTSKPTLELTRRVSTVPREVEESAAPAAKEWRRGKDASGVRMKLSAMGVRSPVRATHVDSGRSAVRVESDVDAPPGTVVGK